jgi:hypothetical protein
MEGYMTSAVLNTHDWPIEILVSLRREELLSQGRHNAFLFALKCKGDVACLRAEIQATEEKIANPPEHLKGPMAPNASPRVYQDGYLAGLKDALKLLTQATNGSAHDVQTDPTPATHQVVETQPA